MLCLQRLRVALACAAFTFGCAAFDSSAQSDTVRPEVGNPLKAAQSLAKSGRHREALAKIAEADAVSGKTAYESFVIQQMRGSVAAAAGDTETAIRSFEAVVDSGRVSGSEKLKIIQALAGLHYRQKDYAKAAQWAQRYRKEGGTDPQIRTVLVQSYFLVNDCANVSKVVGDVSVEASNGRKPPEEDLQMLANCYLKQKDTGGYVAAIEKLVVFYPKKEYWTDLLNRVQKKPGFSDRLALDVFRLKLVSGNLTGAADLMEMAQLALQAGVPAEAKSVVEKGYASGVLGNGKDGERHKRLRDLITKTSDESLKARPQAEKDAAAAADGAPLVNIGLNYVYEGLADKGISMMEQGIRKGNLKRPEDAKLHLGIAQVIGGQKARGIQTLKGVHGTDGTTDVARLWVLHARS